MTDLDLDLGPAPDPGDLDRLRRDVTVDGETRARVRARLAESVLAAAAVGAAAGAAPKAVRVVSAYMYGLVAAAFLAGAATGAAVCARWMATSAPRVVAVDHPAAAPAAASAPSVAAPPPPASLASAAPPGTVTAPPPEATVPSSSAAHAGGTSQLSAERHMLDDARHALLQGEPARALEILERHRRAFPSPLLAEEHGALEVQSLAKAGRYAEARTLGESFRRHYPDSLYLPMVDSALAAMP
jgi:hypothetical protein